MEEVVARVLKQGVFEFIILLIVMDVGGEGDFVLSEQFPLACEVEHFLLDVLEVTFDAQLYFTRLLLICSHRFKNLLSSKDVFGEMIRPIR